MRIRFASRSPAIDEADDTATTGEADPSPAGPPETRDGESGEPNPPEAQDSSAAGGGEDEVPEPRRRPSWRRLTILVVLPILAMLVAGVVGYLRYEQSSLAVSDSVRGTAVEAARDATVKILSYQPDTVEKDLATAQSKLTGKFRDSYSSLTKDVVIPGSKQKKVSAEANVPAAAPVSVSANHAVVLVFVNQAIIVGNDAPTSTTSSVRVTLDKVGGSWLVSGFDPV